MMDVGATRSKTAIIACAAALVLLALAACTDETGRHAPDPAGPATPLDGAHPPLAARACTADVGERTLTCAPPSPPDAAEGPDDVAGLIVGGQGTYVLLESGDVSYDGSAEIFAADVTVTNLIPQAIGTADGATVDADGVRVFFESEPAATGGSGTVTVANADGSVTFTSGTPQDYFEYGVLLEPEATSPEREWRWNVPSGVSADPRSVALGDVDADGKLDIVTADFDGETVTVLLGDGAGDFAEAANSPFDLATTPPFVVTLGDVDGDGALDLVLSTQSTDSDVVVLQSQP